MDEKVWEDSTLNLPLLQVFPDLDMAGDFIEYMTGSEMSAFRTFSDNDKPLKPMNTYGKFDRLSKSLVDQNRQGAGIFWVVNKSKRGGASDKDIEQIRALFVDLDGAPLEPVLSSPCEPHMIVETSPGKYHAYWLIENSLPVEDFTRYQKALARKFSGDSTVSNLSRVMRIPGFFHHKNPDSPYMTRVIGRNDLMPYDPKDIALLLRLDFKGLESASHLSLVKARKTDGMIPCGQRDDQLFRRGCILRNAGLGYPEVLDILQKKNLELCEEPLKDWQVEKIARSVSKLSASVDEDLRIRTKTAETAGLRDEIAKTKKRPAFMAMAKSFCDLEQEIIPPLKWVVPDVLPQGLVLFAGPPKMGKSLVVQQISYAVALGGIAMGKFPTIQGDVLHLALEDSDARFQERMKAQKQLFHDGPAPTSATFINQWSMMPKAISDIKEWCDYVDNPKLVVVDTLGRILGEGVENGNAYKSDYQVMAKFHTLARDYGMAIILVHHLRKMDAGDPMMQVSGSVGLTGAADLVWVFQRKSRNTMDAKIQSMGKDLGDTSYALDFDSEHLSWLCRDFVSEDSDNIVAFLIKEFFKKYPSKRVTASELGDVVRKSRQHVSRVLQKLTRERVLNCSQEKAGYRYMVNELSQEYQS